MKNILGFFLIIVLFVSSCNNDSKPLNQQEQKAVETQVEKDNASMDSLEKAIEAQINADSTVTPSK